MNSLLLSIHEINHDRDLERQRQSKLKESGGFTAIKESIKNIGLKEPLVVYKDKDSYFLCDGYSRLEAIRELDDSGNLPSGLDTESIPCVVIPKEKKNAIRIATDVRQDLLPSQKAKCIKQLFDRDVSRQAIAKMCGYSVNTIRNWLLVSRLIEPLQEKMDTGEMPVDCAVSISPLTESGQYHLLNKIKGWKVIRRDEIRNLVATFSSKYFRLEKEARLALGKKMKVSSIKEKQSLSEKKNLTKSLHRLTIERGYIEEETKRLRTQITMLVAWIEKIFRTSEVKHYIQKNHPTVFDDFNTILEVELGRR